MPTLFALLNEPLNNVVVSFPRVDFQLLQLLFSIFPDSNRLSNRHTTEIANSSLKTLPRPEGRGLGQRDVRTTQTLLEKNKKFQKL